MEERVAAVQAIEFVGAEQYLELLHRAFLDSQPAVRCAALTALGTTADARDMALVALDQADLAVRSTAMLLLATHGDWRDVAAIDRVLTLSGGTENIELRSFAVQALQAIGTQDAERVLQRLVANDESLAIQERAAHALGREWAPPRRPRRRSSVQLQAGVDFASTDRNPLATIQTDAGDLVVELLREAAPHHVKNFRELAESGFFDGLKFHRVEPGFVIQGLDPRGDGWGTGGEFLRDEINRELYFEGTLGMPNAGPDTGGCQIFLTHVPTPHLDGRYTVFGRVVRGMAVVHAIDVGTQCRRVEIIDR